MTISQRMGPQAWGRFIPTEFPEIALCLDDPVVCNWSTTSFPQSVREHAIRSRAFAAAFRRNKRGGRFPAGYDFGVEASRTHRLEVRVDARPDCI
jgi:hypothetical protein